MNNTKKFVLLNVAEVFLGLLSAPTFAADEPSTSSYLAIVERANVAKFWIRRDMGAKSPVYPRELFLDGRSACITAGYSIEKEGHTGILKVLRVFSPGRPLTGTARKATETKVSEYLGTLEYDPTPENPERTPIFTREAVIVFFTGKGFSGRRVDPRDLATHCAVRSLSAELKEPAQGQLPLTEDPIEVEVTRTRVLRVD